MKFKLEDIQSDKYLGLVFERPYEKYVLVIGHVESAFRVWNISVITPDGGVLGYTTHYRGRSKDTSMTPADYSKIPEEYKKAFVSSLFKLEREDL